MSETTRIEWCDATFNAWIGCTKVSLGPQGACENCYAEVSTPSRAMRIKWGAGEPRHLTSAANWNQPLTWERQHEAFFAEHGHRRRVFCSSLADVFDNEVPAEWRANLFQLIHDTPNVDWLLLTKRIGNVKAMIEAAADFHFDRGDRNVAGWLTDWYKHGIPPKNVWLGSTIANQPEADRDIPKLLAVPAIVRFLSCEPLLAHIDLTRYLTSSVAVDWVIVGGESGPKARPMNISWAVTILAACFSNGVPAFLKQLGARVNWDDCHAARPIINHKGGDMREWPEALRVRQFPAVP